MPRIDAYLVVGGRFHDFDFARLELLKLLAENEDVRVRVGGDYADVDAIAASRFLVSYTCDVRPTVQQQDGLGAFVAGGGRWLALHGTNSALDLNPPQPVESPRIFPKWADLLGSQFVAHPPIAPYTVTNVAPDHDLVRGVNAFDTDDELYLCEYHGELEALLATRFSGVAKGFAEADWPDDEPRLVAYLRRYGHGCVYYLTLGHCRSKYDMQPFVAEYPRVERGSWKTAELYELLRRGLRWAADRD